MDQSRDAPVTQFSAERVPITNAVTEDGRAFARFRIVEHFDHGIVVHTAITGTYSKGKDGTPLIDIVPHFGGRYRPDQEAQHAAAINSTLAEFRKAPGFERARARWSIDDQGPIDVIVASGFGVGIANVDGRPATAEEQVETCIRFISATGRLDLWNPIPTIVVRDTTANTLRTALATSAARKAEAANVLRVGDFKDGDLANRWMGPVVPMQIGRDLDVFSDKLQTILRERHGLTNVEILPASPSNVDDPGQVARVLRDQFPLMFRVTPDGPSTALVIPRNLDVIDTAVLASVAKRLPHIIKTFPNLTSVVKVIESDADSTFASTNGTFVLLLSSRCLAGNGIGKFAGSIRQRVDNRTFVRTPTDEIGYVIDEAALWALALSEVERPAQDGVVAIALIEPENRQLVDDFGVTLGERWDEWKTFHDEAVSTLYADSTYAGLLSLGRASNFVRLLGFTAKLKDMRVHSPKLKISLMIKGETLPDTRRGLLGLPVRLSDNTKLGVLPCKLSTLGGAFANTVRFLANPELDIADPSREMQNVRRRLAGFYE